MTLSLYSFIHAPSFDCCTILRSSECRGSLLQTVPDPFLRWIIFKFEISVNGIQNPTDMSSRNVYEFSYEQKAVVWLCVVYPLLLDKNQRCFLRNKSKQEMCMVPLRSPRFLCISMCNINPTKVFHRKRVQLLQDCFGTRAMSSVSLFWKWNDCPVGVTPKSRQCKVVFVNKISVKVRRFAYQQIKLG